MLVRVLTDGMDNDPQYRNRTAEQVLAELQRDFPAVDGETIRANLVLLGDLELDVRNRPSFPVSHDPNITVIFPPVIVWEPPVVRVGTNVVFSEKSQAGYRYFDWWIDGQPVSRQASFSHTFTNSGRHTVRLLVASTDGLRESRTEALEVSEVEKPAPLAPRMTFLPATPQPGEKVRFVGWATGQGIMFSWRLNGQEFATGTEAERVFAQEGRFEITLVAADGTGRSEQTNQVITVVERPLRVAFAAPPEARSGQAVQFANDTQPVERVAAWAWMFGDGGTSAERNPLHPFLNEGETLRTFNVVLWATNRTGKAYASASQAIAVLPAQKPVPPPKAAFRVLGGPFKAGRMMAFQDESTGLIDAFAWNFNGEGSDERKNPEFKFEAAGTKTVRLGVRGPGGTNTASQQITVEPREVSAQLVWLSTNGQSVALPEKLDYGKADPVVIKTGELNVSVDDTFDVILPAGMEPGQAVVLALDEALSNIFEVQQRAADSFRPLPMPARLLESGRFRVDYLRTNVAEGDHNGALTIRAEGPGFLLNGKDKPIMVAMHLFVTGGGGGIPPGVIILLLVAAGLLAWLLLWPRPLRYPVALTLEEITPKTQSGGAADATSLVPSRTFLLQHASEMVCLGADPDHTHIYDLNAANWFIMANEKTLDLCSRSGGSSRKLKSGEVSLVTDATNRSRRVKTTFESAARQKPGEPNPRTT